VKHCWLQAHGETADNEPVSSDACFDGRFTMSDVSQGEGWWLASDGRWYSPQDHPNDRPAPLSQLSIPQVSASSDPAEELSTDRSAIAVATARQCANGHEMPESSVFCSVCGGRRSEVPPDTSDLEVLGVEAHQAKNARIVVAVIAVCVLGLGLGLGLTGGSSGSSSSSGSSTSNTQL
jgi:hypothetical protein